MKTPKRWRAFVPGLLRMVRTYAEAHTKSEARAKIKRELGLKRKQRLPIGTHIEQLPDRS
jgi:hypothetical protein